MNSDNGSTPKKVIHIVDVDTLDVEDRTFESNGTCVVKVTKDGVEEGRRFKIRSTAFSETLDKMRELMPHPPTMNTLVTWDSEMGRSVGITREQGRRWIGVPNTNDEEYRRKLDEANKQLTFETINAGLVNELREGGQIISRDQSDKRIKALEKMGLTVHQFNQLSEAINHLTQIPEKDREAFFAPDLALEATL